MNANPQATAALAARHPTLSYNTLADTGLLVSQAGFGTYRVHPDMAEHRQALAQALRMGINLVDTSTNYGAGAAETLVGQTIAELCAANQLRRQEIVVVSKAGYLQGEMYQLSQERKEQGNRFPDLVQFAPGLEHCIHPTFLQDQLTRSLERLQLDTIDFYLLHNPEYFLQGAARSGLPPDEARRIYDQRIELAFRHLEQEVAAGRISWYGISSNTFPQPADNEGHTSLARVLEIAQGLGADHHFRLVQFPMNLFEPGAATELNQPGDLSLLAYARRQELATLVNRPLNAIQGERLLRLAGVPLPDDPVDPQVIPGQLSAMVDAERALFEQLLPGQAIDDERISRLKTMLVVGRLLQGQWDQLGSYHQWMEIVTQQLMTRVNYGLHLLSDTLAAGDEATIPAAIGDWMSQYAEQANLVFSSVGRYYQGTSAQRAALIRAHVRIADPDWDQPGTLSQVAIRALRSTAGVSSVLVGMRHEAYLEDVLKELSRPIPVAPRLEAWRRLAVGA